MTSATMTSREIAEELVRLLSDLKQLEETEHE